MNRTVTRVAVLLCSLMMVSALAGHQLSAQDAQTFTIRLSPLPVDGPPMMATIAGLGTATASLTGTRLRIEGTFEGLVSPATQLALHRAPRGLRGPAILELPPPPRAVSGKFSATVELNPSQLEDLKQRRLYLQLSSEKAGEGNLWGWLLPRENQA